MSLEAPTEAAPEGVTRRQFLVDALLTTSMLALLAGAANAIVRFLQPPKQSAGGGEQVPIASEDEIPVGDSRNFTYQDGQYTLIHAPTGFLAFSRVCTHAGCLVTWDSKSLTFKCPCHAAVFDQNGAVVSGPAPKPLPPLKVTESGGKILVGG